MKSIEWWRGTATHMWRTYFALERDGIGQASGTDRKIHAMCGKVLESRFSDADREILKTYFTSEWGKDLYTVEDYSLRNNIPTKVIWMVIRRANRTVMEECGLLDSKGGEEE